ncbi:MAG: hypothetical protein PHS01_07130, partial [Dysgonamonadaceae bacterium]|nr:hypothetical protein [Dysgonamonadaceae bacterium]
RKRCRSLKIVDRLKTMPLKDKSLLAIPEDTDSPCRITAVSHLQDGILSTKLKKNHLFQDETSESPPRMLRGWSEDGPRMLRGWSEDAPRMVRYTSDYGLT